MRQQIGMPYWLVGIKDAMKEKIDAEIRCRIDSGRSMRPDGHQGLPVFYRLRVLNETADDNTGVLTLNLIHQFH